MSGNSTGIGLNTTHATIHLHDPESLSAPEKKWRFHI